MRVTLALKFFSSARGSWGAYRIVLELVSVSLATFSVILSETAWPIKAKLYLKFKYEASIGSNRGTNVHVNNPGHMTKMAVMPIIICVNCFKNHNQSSGLISMIET